jgi:hypothetical protein
MNGNETPFIFYLTLEENLPKNFYIFDKTLKAQGFILVPVKVDQLQKIMSMTDQTQVMVLCSVSDSKEMKLYNEKVRPLLKFILKSKRLTFMHLGSFSKLNDSRVYSMNKNYYFMKYPLDAGTLSKQIVRYYELKSETNVRWPGGKRAGLGAIV